MKNKVLKTIGFFIVCFLVSTGNICAQYATDVTVTDIRDVTLSKKMEQEASKLLTAFNDAYIKNKQPELKNVKDQKSISAIWAISPLKCIETEIIERGYSTSSGYQIRNIPMFLKDVSEEDAERDIAINFDKQGNITDIYFCISANVLEGMNEVTDLRKRVELIDFVEKFRTAYNRKDIKAVKSKFSEDAEIITGRVTKVKKVEGSGFEEIIEFKTQTLPQYIDGLTRTFANNKVIDVKYEDIELQQHSKYDHIYGVTFKQIWDASNYSDIGYVFLCIDFHDKEPFIKVRTWQPEQFQGRIPRIEELFEL